MLKIPSLHPTKEGLISKLLRTAIACLWLGELLKVVAHCLASVLSFKATLSEIVWEGHGLNSDMRWSFSMK